MGRFSFFFRIFLLPPRLTASFILPRGLFRASHPLFFLFLFSVSTPSSPLPFLGSFSFFSILSLSSKMRRQVCFSPVRHTGRLFFLFPGLAISRFYVLSSPFSGGTFFQRLMSEPGIESLLSRARSFSSLVFPKTLFFFSLQ